MAEKNEISQGETAHPPKYDDHGIVPIEEEAQQDAQHINLSWRSWVVVFVTCFAYVRFLRLLS